MKVYYISPHFDDAIGSCGGKIHSDIINGNDVYLVTIFSKVTAPFSDYANSLHDYWKLSDPFNDRKKENFEACKSLGVKAINLEYEDAIYRKKDNIYLYPNDGDIFKGIVPDDKSLLKKIYTDFKKNFSKDYNYYFPMSIGKHVDHCITNIIGRKIKCNGYNIIFYSDFSYEDVTSNRNKKKQIFYLTEENIKAKINAVSKYKSQIFMIFGSAEKIEEYYRNKLNKEEIYYE